MIDYDKLLDEEEERYQTYFLNPVDEADLLALLEDEDGNSPITCSCTCLLYTSGMGYWTRSNAEICLLATKGHPKRQSSGVHQLIISPI